VRNCAIRCATRRCQADRRKNGLRLKTNFASRFNSHRCQPSSQKKAISFFQKLCLYHPRPASARGAYRDRHDTRGGMRWTWLCRQTTGTDMDGQVVWSWHPDADAQRNARKLRCRDTVANKPGAPARARSSRNTIAQGRPVLAEPVVLPRAFCCTRTMGISGYPAFPAPSS